MFDSLNHRYRHIWVVHAVIDLSDDEGDADGAGLVDDGDGRGLADAGDEVGDGDGRGLADVVEVSDDDAAPALLLPIIGAEDWFDVPIVSGSISISDWGKCHCFLGLTNLIHRMIRWRRSCRWRRRSCRRIAMSLLSIVLFFRISI